MSIGDGFMFWLAKGLAEMFGFVVVLLIVLVLFAVERLGRRR